MTDKNKAVEAREEVPEKTFENVEGAVYDILVPPLFPLNDRTPKSSGMLLNHSDGKSEREYNYALRDYFGLQKEYHNSKH